MSPEFFPSSAIAQALSIRLGIEVHVLPVVLDDDSLGIEVFMLCPYRLMGSFSRPSTRPELDIFVEEVYHLWVFGG